MSERYSFSLTTFSPSGELLQIKYALNAVTQGSTAIGIKVKDGVVIAIEKKLPVLTDESSVKLIETLSDNIGVTYAGMGPDFRLLVKLGRKKAQEYQRFWKEPIPVLMMVRELANIMQEYTQSGGVRPFGVSLLVCGYDDKGPQLFQVDPSGSFFAWKASAIGRGMVPARDALERRHQDETPVDDALHRAISILKKGFQGAMDETNLEIGIITNDRKFKTLSPARILALLEEVGSVI